MPRPTARRSTALDFVVALCSGVCEVHLPCAFAGAGGEPLRDPQERPDSLSRAVVATLGAARFLPGPGKKHGFDLGY